MGEMERERREGEGGRQRKGRRARDIERVCGSERAREEIEERDRGR